MYAQVTLYKIRPRSNKLGRRVKKGFRKFAKAPRARALKGSRNLYEKDYGPGADKVYRQLRALDRYLDHGQEHNAEVLTKRELAPTVKDIIEGTEPLAKIRDDAVRAHHLEFSATREFFYGPGRELDTAKLGQWVDRTREFVQELYGPENVARGTLHLDQTTPHLHFVAVPIRDGKLSSSKFFGQAEDLERLQTEYAESVKDLDLERGQEHSPYKHVSRETWQATKQIEMAHERAMAGIAMGMER
jgi:hypothetical protein